MLTSTKYVYCAHRLSFQPYFCNKKRDPIGKHVWNKYSKNIKHKDRDNHRDPFGTTCLSMLRKKQFFDKKLETKLKQNENDLKKVGEKVGEKKIEKVGGNVGKKLDKN